MTDKKTKTPVTIDEKEYMLEDMSEVGQRLVQHTADLDRKIANLAFQLEQMQMGRENVMSKLQAEIKPEETQAALERKIYEKFSGSSNAGKFIIAFNESQDTKADIEPIHLPDAHAQYQFMSDEAREKIMLGHGIVSPILLGIKDNTGFGNNAEELRTAAVLMDNVIIRPLQDGIIEALEDILKFNDIDLDLYFITLQPIEFTELDNISTKVKREEETGEKLSSQIEVEQEINEIEVELKDEEE